MEKKRSDELDLVLRVFIGNERVEFFVVLVGMNDAACEENRGKLQKTCCGQHNGEDIDVIGDFVFELK